MDPDGEFPHILGGALLGGFIDGAGGFNQFHRVPDKGKRESQAKGCQYPFGILKV